MAPGSGPPVSARWAKFLVSSGLMSVGFFCGFTASETHAVWEFLCMIGGAGLGAFISGDDR